MTPDEKTEWRLDALEKQAEGSRHVERQVDLLAAGVARFEASLAGLEAAALTRDTHMRESIGRLHRRLDELDKVEQVEQGAKLERARLARWLFSAVGVSAGIASMITGIVALLMR